ncbi:response regulator transcription factor [Chroogloeocystis siderophila]|uniref:Response regulator n=1 Tax=Chroogloeocystis siderophila 5.2 s.c.1 TaxID=247279 RepID=A0A1U7HZH9_9CHRO|nr:response regulator [Chroogloeocystis siderophila]OKH29044.1 response regulator [Chroogloeocystis siderophila 5.2 s.c.1]
MKKILVIEDEPDVRANIIELLEAEEFHVVAAENGFFGALWAQEYLPDLIICDVRMPELNGYDVLTALRQDAATATIPFIFLTANADRSDMRRGMELGADDYLTKPFSRTELLNAIASRFAKQEVVMQQYNNERERADSLKQKVQELENYASAKASIVPKLNIAMSIVKNLPPGLQRDRCLEILRQVCNEEIKTLNNTPALQKLLPAESITFLRQFNLVFKQ